MKPGKITQLSMQVCCKYFIRKHFINYKRLLRKYQGWWWAMNGLVISVMTLSKTMMIVLKDSHVWLWPPDYADVTIISTVGALPIRHHTRIPHVAKTLKKGTCLLVLVFFLWMKRKLQLPELPINDILITSQFVSSIPIRNLLYLYVFFERGRPRFWKKKKNLGLDKLL